MSRKKKSGNQNLAEKVILITAILNLIRALVEFINRLIE